MKLQDVFGSEEGGCELDPSRSCGNDEWLNKAKILSESLPYIQQFLGETFVIKYGGAAMVDQELASSFARDVVLLKQLGINPVIVHGGSGKITEVMAKLGKESVFVNGLRVTDAETLEVVEMVLCGLVNKNIAQLISEAGGYGIGLSGKDAGLVEARKVCCTSRGDRPNNVEQIMDIGFVGEPSGVNTDLLFFLEESDFIPVVAPVCKGANGVTYNVDANLVAGAIASALSAAKLIVMTDVNGIEDDNGGLLSELSVSKAEKIISEGVAGDRMVSKLQACVKFAKETCGSAHIVNGKIPHALLLELFTGHGIGTMLSCDVGGSESI